jgi:iron complex transport system permease protein
MSLARLRLLADTLSRMPRFWRNALLATMLVAATVSATRGAVPVPLRDLIPAAIDDQHPLHTVVWEVRLPRVVVAALTGASLAVAGCLLQTVVRNPLADPALLGVTAGAGAAALSAIVLWPESSAALPFFAFAGALGSTAIILLLAFTGARSGPLKIILSGVAVQAVLFSIIALITFFFADRAPSFVAFTVGSLNGSGWSDVQLVIVPAVVGIAISLAASRALNILLFDDATGGGIGLDVARVRLGAAAVAALLAAGAVSVAGLLGFVGLVVPNLVRVVSGPDHRTLIPLAATAGAALMIVADLIARVAVAPLEVPVGALLALIGGPYLLILLRRKLA